MGENNCRFCIYFCILWLEKYRLGIMFFYITEKEIEALESWSIVVILYIIYTKCGLAWFFSQTGDCGRNILYSKRGAEVSVIEWKTGSSFRQRYYTDGLLCSIRMPSRDDEAKNFFRQTYSSQYWMSPGISSSFSKNIMCHMEYIAVQKKNWSPFLTKYEKNSKFLNFSLEEYYFKPIN